MEDSFEFIKIYFTEEKIESLFFIFTGFLSIALAFIFLLIIKYSFYKGLAFPLLIFGMIQLIVGVNIFIESNKQIERFIGFMAKDSEMFFQNEIQRMEIVMNNFEIYKGIEITLFLCGLIMYFYFKSLSQRFWKGIGIGLIIQISILFTFDLIAEQRGELYMESLKKISVNYFK